MKRTLFLSSIGAALFLAPVLLSAQSQETPSGRPNGRPGAPGQFRRGNPDAGPMERGPAMAPRRDFRAELGLSEAQQADMRKTMENARKDRLRKSTDLRIANLDLRSLLRGEKVDEKAVAVKLAEAQAAQAALMKLRVDSAMAMKRILTPEQQKKLAEFRSERRRARLGRGMRMPDRPGNRGNNRSPRMRRMMPGGAGAGQGAGFGAGAAEEFDLDLDNEVDTADFDLDAEDGASSIPAVLR